MRRVAQPAGKRIDVETRLGIGAARSGSERSTALHTGPLDESRALGTPIELAIVVPTYNERENVFPLLEALEQALAGIAWEVIFVDDNSPDGTAERIRRVSAVDRRVRVIERIGQSGLSSACITGMLSTPSPYIAVMDGDLQHDETVLPAMLERIMADRLDIVIASRNIQNGSMGEFSRRRVWISKLGTKLSRLICPRGITDAMSGFFLVDRAFFRQVAPHLSGVGFKLLVDILSSSPKSIRVGEVAYHFRNRQRGESKLNVKISLAYLYLLLRKVLRMRLAT